MVFGVALAALNVLPPVHCTAVDRGLLRSNPVIHLWYHVRVHRGGHHRAVGKRDRRRNAARRAAPGGVAAPVAEQAVERVVLQVQDHYMPDWGVDELAVGRPSWRGNGNRLSARTRRGSGG